jgi:flagellar biogenesis protein FliO
MGALSGPSPFLAVQAAAGGVAWLKLVGGLVVVFTLLLLFLKLLGRFQGGRPGAAAALVAVHAVGPRRAVELLRCGDEVFTLYRHEQTVVLLDRAPYDPARHAPPAPALPVGGLIDRLLGRRGRDA